MAITAGGLAGGGFANSATSVTRSVGTVTAGQLVVVWGSKFSTSADAFVAGDCTQSAGTATLGAFQLDRQDGGASSSNFVYAGVWSAIVTASGTLTVQIAGAPAGSYLLIGAEVFNGSWDASRAEDSNGGLIATDATASTSTGNATSAGAALFCAALGMDNTAGNTVTQDGAFSLVFESEAGTEVNGGHAYRIVSTGTTDAGDWTHGTAHVGTAATLVVYREIAGPTVSADPADQTVNSGAAATFTGAATGGTAPLTYQWQDNSGGSFADISGATSASYSPTAAYSMQGRQYRLVITDSAALTATTAAAALRVAFNLTGTGPRSVPLFGGGPFGAGAFGEVERAPLVAGSGTPVGTATETDTALGLAGKQSRAVGLSTETDAALALAARQVRPAGLATETDAALALPAVQSRAVGLASETDTAFALSAGASASVGLASEVDAALALAAVQIRATGLAAETDAAFALAGLQARPTGLSTETDQALALAAVQSRAVGLAAETDTALALSPGINGAVGLAVETDTALALAGVQRLPVGLSAETDAALALSGVQARAVGTALESDTALALAAVQSAAAGLAVEIDEALALLPGGPVAIPVGLAVETDTAFALQPGADEVLESAGGRLGWVERGPFVRRTFATRGAPVAYSLAPRILPGAPKPREAVTVRAPLVHAGRLPSAVARKPRDLRLTRSPKPALIRSADLIT